MDPTNRGPEEYGHGNDRSAEDAVRRRQSREPLTPDFGLQTPQQSRTVQLITGDFLLTVNPVDGSEIEPCPPGMQPAAPVRRTAAERAERERATAPPVPPGPPGPRLPLLEREEERERLVRLLAQGRSVRLTGPAGSGRTALLNAVAADCADLAPDGVVRLSGHRRTANELLYGLFEAVHRSPLYRPGREELEALVRGIGAVVVLDDLELGGSALEELLDATPECAFLFGAGPEVAAPTADSNLEEVFLSGLGRAASIELLEHVVERTLTDEEANWAGDLWFESQGLPLRFVQAGALLRQRDQLRTDPEAFDGYEDGDQDDLPFGRPAPVDVPLPSLGEGAAPAALLGSRMTEAARQTLRFAVALGGEVPHQAHLPALVGDTHADAALGELFVCGLLSPAGPRYRLAAGVLAQLEASGYGEEADTFARNAAQHYAWWAGHPSVTPERAVAEADAVLAALTHLVPGGDHAGTASAAVLLARSAAPAFAAGMRWGAWEKALRIGQEAARIAGEVAEEAYFHHELGVLALCAGNLDRARAELEVSIGMRGALADKPGAVAGRRALALVTDRSGLPLPVAGRGATSGSEDPEGKNVTTEQSADEDDGESGLVEDEPGDEDSADDVTSGSRAPSTDSSGTASPSDSGTPSPSASEPGTSPSSDDTTSGSPSDRPTSGDPSPSRTPTKSTSPTPTTAEPTDPTTEPTPDPTETTPTTPPSGPESSNSASGPAESATATASATSDGPAPDGTSDTTPTTLA